MPYEKEFFISKFAPFDQVAYQNRVYIVTDMRFNSELEKYEYELAHKFWVSEVAIVLVDEENLVNNF